MQPALLTPSGRPPLLLAVLLALSVVAACEGVIAPAGDGEVPAGGPGPAPALLPDGGPAVPGAGGAPEAGRAAGDGGRPDAFNPDPTAQVPRFACADPSTRGLGQAAMRRLTRDEWMDSITAVVGGDVMASEAIERAAARIPLEPPGDRVATFQNGHASDHVEGILLTAQAVAAEVVQDAPSRDRVLGDCAATADRACAEAFLDGAALRLLRRPLDAERRQSLLASFQSEGAGLAGMQWLLARVLQAPETVFHLELPRLTCDVAPPPDRTVFAWDDESVFFAPNGGEPTGPREAIETVGWYVWQIPGPRIAHDYTELVLDVVASSGNGEPIELNVNLNDNPVRQGIRLDAGAHTLRMAVSIAAGSNAKVGVYFSNGDAGGTLELRSLSLESDQPEADCTDTPGPAGRFVVDDWSVASRVAFALTGEGPDAALLEAAAGGELATIEQVMPHAERLAATPAARRQFEAVLDAWLDLEAIPSPHPAIAALAGIDPVGLAAEARRELLDYATYQVFDRDADVETLMSERIGFPRSDRMATLYGSDVAPGNEPVDLTEGHGGLLLRVAPLLSGQLGSSPILRGVYVRKRLLCDVLPSPDFTIVNSRLEQFEATDRTELSTRDAVTVITSEGACPTCHVQINPLGFALEAFGPLGQPRDEEIVFDEDGAELARHPIDSTVSEVHLEVGAPDVLSGPEALNAALADSAKVRACIAERLYTYARLRPAADVDACGLAEVEAGLRSGGTIREAWLSAVVNEELFVRQSEEAAP